MSVSRAGEPVAWGVDVSTRALDAVALDEAGRLAAVRMVPPSDLDALVGAVAGAAVVAVDAPDRWSQARHAADTTLSAKFRTARCAEIALLRDHGYAVPWPTPAGPTDRSGWMEVGIEVHTRLSAVAGRTVEVFPHAAFLRLAGRRSLPAKASLPGARVRAELLAGRLTVDADELLLWSADGRDALAAALTAHDAALGRSVVAACAEHPDDSAIHLPAER